MWLPPALSARLPPSAGRITPVTSEAAGEARNTTGRAISSGCPSRFSGMPERIRSIRAWSKSVWVMRTRNPGVRIWQGATAFTRIPCFAHSTASSRVIETIPPLATL